jgi:hypothetical protein
VVDSVTKTEPVPRPKKKITEVVTISCGPVYGGAWIVTGMVGPIQPTGPLVHLFDPTPPVNKEDTDCLDNIPPGVTDKDPLAANDPAPKPAIPPDSWYEAILPATWRIRRRS